MEVKKIIIVLLVAMLSVFSFFVFSDNTQYKQIGNTNFYLLPNETGQESSLFFNDGSEDAFLPIYHDGFVHDIYWNQHFIIMKCTEPRQEHWYIIRNIKDYNYSEFMINHFMREEDYQSALDSLGISETNFEHTNGTIPWKIHL